MFRISFGMGVDINKINSSSAKSHVKESAISSRISHIDNKNTTWYIPSPVQEITMKISPQLLNSSESRPIYNQSSSVSTPPALPPRIMNNDPSVLLSQRGNIENNTLLARRHNNINIPKLNILQTNESVRLNENRTLFLDAFKKSINTDKYNEKAQILFNNLNELKYNPNDYQSIEDSRYSNQLKYREDTLIKVGKKLLPANDVSSYNSHNMTIASQYPLNNKESLKNYFNMLFDNDIKTVYVLASNDDIKKDLSKLGDEYNKSDFEKEGFKYFRENLDLDDIKSSHIEKRALSENKTNGAYLDCKTYTKLVTKENSDEKKKINFVHIYDWKDHTGIDATKLRNTIDTIGDNLKINPTKENIVVHCLAGLGRTGEFIALMEMMKMIEAGNTEGKSLESIISDLKEKRSIRALYQPEQIAELAKYAINNNIPLLNDDIKMK